eukprot:TRINITY_DN942_c0_g1_i1.p1 TRINITY_DN942_c0_g1~~TRINITY_DN942_c0_g1_i1.p1  ORF type:complete len:100 (+),score=9.28 TRINITY_DN942_c0_g1_i1:66-365(+)
MSARQLLRRQVISLYKRLLWAGRGYPQGYDVFRNGLKKAFSAQRDLSDKAKIEEAIKRGEYVLLEVEALLKLHRYRTLRKSYNKPESLKIPGYTITDKK